LGLGVGVGDGVGVGVRLGGRRMVGVSPNALTLTAKGQGSG